MRTSPVRPDIGTLMFRLYGRSLHPELFEVRSKLILRQENWSARISILDDGHLLCFEHRGGVLFELVTSAGQPVPERKQYLARKLRGSRSESVTQQAGVQYHCGFQSEQLEADLFAHHHEELLIDATRCRLSHHFKSANRLSPAPLSCLHIEEQPGSLVLHAFHTFPDNLAVVKTQSLIELC